MASSFSDRNHRILHQTGTWLKYILGSLLALIIFTFIIVAINSNLLKKLLLEAASALSGREIRMEGDLAIQPFSSAPHVVINQLIIGNPDWAEDREMARIEKLDFNFRWLPLLGGKIVMPQVSIIRPNILFLRQSEEQANWIIGKNDDRRGGLQLPAIQHLTLIDGKLDVKDAVRKVDFSGTVQSLPREDGNEDFQMVGDGTLNGKDFSFDMSGPPLLKIDASKPYGLNLDIHLAATRVNAKGEITRPFDLGNFYADLDLQGDDLADLYLITGLALPNTPKYHLSGKLIRDDDEFDFSNFGGTLGGSDLLGNLKVLTGGDRPKIVADLKSKKLDIVDLGSLFGAEVPGANIPREAQNVGPVLLLPDAPLQVERVRNMDAEVHYRAESLIAHGLPLKEVALDFTLENAVLKFNPFAVTLPQGKLSGIATVDANPDVPVVDMDVRLTGARLEDFFEKKDGNAPLEGPVMARIKLHGNGNSVHRAAANSDGNITMAIPRGEIRRAFAELMGINIIQGLGLLLSDDQEKTELRCAVASFRVKNGIMRPRLIVMDTGVVLTTGEGTINLKNEAIDIALQGHPKEAELVRVIAPINLGGTLRNPTVGVDVAAAAGQLGIAAALGAVLTPLASILPFLSPDLADDANCGYMIDMAKQKGGVTNWPVATPEAAKKD